MCCGTFPIIDFSPLLHVNLRFSSLTKKRTGKKWSIDIDPNLGLKHEGTVENNWRVLELFQKLIFLAILQGNLRFSSLAKNERAKRGL